MRRPLALFSCLLGMAPVALTVAAAERGFEVRDLVTLERVSDPRLSPDGDLLVYALRQTDMDGNRGINSLWALDPHADSPRPRRLTAEGESWNSPRFDQEGRLYASTGKSGSNQVWRLDLDGGEPVQITDYPLGVGTWGISRDGSHLAVSFDVFPDCDTLACTVQRKKEHGERKASGVLYDRLFVRHWDTWKDGTRSQLFVSRLGRDGKASGEPVRVSKGLNGDVPTKPFGGDGDFVFTAGGKSLIFVLRDADAALESTSTNLDLWQVPVDGSAAPINLTGDFPGSDSHPVISPDGWTLAWLSMARPGFEADRHRIMLRNLASGEVRELAADWDRSAGDLAFSADSKTLYVTANDVGQNPLFAIDVASGEVSKLTGDGYVAGFAIGESVTVVGLNNLAAPVDLYRLEGEGKAPTRLTSHNADKLAGIAFGAYEQFSFEGANDATVYAYVVKPWNFAEGKRYPVAFIIHGGPQGSMSNNFHYRWNPQTYAGAGYAVVFVDFHGSTGYGQAFTDSISQDWGGKPLVDLQKGWAAALAKYPWLDGDKACALGASYGGYMVNWIAGNWNEPWKCLVNHDGVFDTRAMGYETEELWFTEWENGGTPWEQPENHEKFNPALHVDKWRVPMLVVQGELDYRIPTTQSLATFTALQRKGIESQLLYFPDENHWVLKPANSVLWHDTVKAWLNRWLM